LRKYLGALGFLRVLGRWKVVFLLTFVGFFDLSPSLTAFAALVALAAGAP